MPYKDPEKRREMARIYTARWRERHPEKNAESQRKSKAGRPTHRHTREQHTRLMRRYRAKHRERVNAYMREYSRARPWVDGRRRKSSPETIALLLGDPCAYCGGPAGEIDHIEPWATSRDPSDGNLTSACRSCNARKGKRTLLFFLLDRLAA